MIAHYEIKQGTPEWHEIRWGKLGGTLAKGLFVKSDTLLYDLLSEITEPFQLEEDSFISSDMIRGFELEPQARKLVSQYIGVDLMECGWLQCEEIQLLGISPDGISQDETVSAEIKCPASKKHVTTICLDAIPLDNIHQCIHYFTVNPKLERHYFCSYRPESIKPLFVKELTRESVVNIGTNSKPIMVTVQDAVMQAKREAVSVQEQIESKVNQLQF